MAQQALLDIIDREIAKLQQVRDLFEGAEADTAAPGEGDSEPNPAAKRRGAPKGVKHNLSEDARARIAAGQKKRRAAEKDVPENTAEE